MANKAISELPQAQNVNNQDLFVLEQSGIAKKLTAETFITEQGIIDALAEALDGHGGIQSVTLSSVSGRIRTYRITFTDQSATTFQVYDGTSIDRISRTSSSGLDDVYTIFLSDGTTTFFTVHNGADGNVSEAMLNDALKDKAPAITETTESSAIANFPDGADDMPIQSLVAEIEPIQDLNGYDNPWPAGSGKNILPIMSSAVTNNGVTWTPQSDGSVLVKGTASGGNSVWDAGRNAITLPAGTYTANTSSGNIQVTIFSISGGTATVIGGGGGTFTISEETSVFIRFYVASGTAVDVTLYPQLESGSTATSFAPYSNICPISGWTGCNVTRTGKNLMDSAEYTGTKNGVNYEYKNGVLKLTGTASATSWLDFGSGVTLPSGYAYKITVIPIKSRRTSSDKMLIGCSFAYVNMNGVKASNQTAVVSSAQNIRPSLKLTSGQVYDDEYQMLLEFATLATTEFDPPQAPTTVSLSWTTEAGTVYGGTIDVATGLLTVDRVGVDLGTLTWTYLNDGIFRTPKISDMPYSYLPNWICSMYIIGTTTNYAGWKLRNNQIGFLEGGSFVICMNTAYTDAASFTAAMNGQTLVYELATSQTYQLTPQEVKTLLGTNNVWTDTGNVSVTYPADTKMFIEKLTMPTEDDMVANQAITSGKYFMIGNSLYLALANIASGAQITIGTNAQRVSLADALNTINS